MKLKKIPLEIWELPQNTLGFLIKLLFGCKLYTTYEGVNVYSWCFNGGISLGRYIFVGFKKADPNSPLVQELIKHEYGHTIQSKYLGWFYLLVIGIPSFIWANCFKEYRKKTGKSYYSFYAERWADKLGGVERNEDGT